MVGWNLWKEGKGKYDSGTWRDFERAFTKIGPSNLWYFLFDRIKSLYTTNDDCIRFVLIFGEWKGMSMLVEKYLSSFSFNKIIMNDELTAVQYSTAQYTVVTHIDLQC